MTWFTFGRQLIQKLKVDRVTGLAAEQAYYYLLSLFPMLILLLSILPYLSINPQAALTFLHDFVPSETNQLIEETIITILSERNGRLLTIGIIGTIWSASNGMNAFIHSMNIAFEVQETRGFIMTRLLSIILTFGIILAFIVALALPVFGQVLLDFVNQLFPISDHGQRLFHLLRWVIAVVVISIVLAFLYQIAPSKPLPLQHVWIGAVTAALLWLLISFGFSFYVNNFGNYSATYGSLGGVIILMLWLFLTGLALIIGGEINAILQRNHTAPHSKTTRHFFF
ncbi:YihY/virulence factor BrkB family protein [Peribacillus asahii]|uniref:YihY/virulence factor BrkB family protein n=1 Tax=Peribacillus asahii TaxID=228899 RepID=UPI0037FE25B7